MISWSTCLRLVARVWASSSIEVVKVGLRLSIEFRMSDLLWFVVLCVFLLDLITLWLVMLIVAVLMVPRWEDLPEPFSHCCSKEPWWGERYFGVPFSWDVHCQPSIYGCGSAVFLGRRLFTHRLKGEEIGLRSEGTRSILLVVSTQSWNWSFSSSGSVELVWTISDSGIASLEFGSKITSGSMDNSILSRAAFGQTQSKPLGRSFRTRW